MSQNLSQREKAELLKQQMLAKIKPQGEKPPATQSSQGEKPPASKRGRKNIEEGEEEKPRAPKFNPEKFKQDLEAKLVELVQNVRDDTEHAIQTFEGELRDANLDDLGNRLKKFEEGVIEKMTREVSKISEDSKRSANLDVIRARLEALQREWSQVKKYFRKENPKRPSQSEAIANFEQGLSELLK